VKDIINFFSLNLGNPSVDAKFGRMYRSFFRGINDHGWQVIYSDDCPSPKADILVVPMGGGQDFGSVQAMRRFAGPVVLYVPPAHEWFDQCLLNRIFGRVIFAYGTDCSNFSKKMYARVGIDYHYLPFASDPEMMKPLHLPHPYDVVFVGSLEHATRRMMFLEPLIKALDKRPSLFIGSGWRIYDIPDQLIAWGPLLNIVYNLGKVCVNIHADAQIQGKDMRLDLNNRVFDLAMSGCCQVCDNPEGVRECFSEDEVAIADKPNEWVDLVMHMLNHPADAEAYRQKAFNRALNEHTWYKRAGEFIEFIDKADMNRCKGNIGDIGPHWGLIQGEAKRQLIKILRPIKHSFQKLFSYKNGKRGNR
jgi:hypothetical protein